jgi:hypothetical protein
LASTPTSSAGQGVVGVVFVPPGVLPPGTALQVSPGRPFADAGQVQGLSLVVEISAFDAETGQAVRDFADSGGQVEICLEVSDADSASKHGCLGFLDETEGQWKCQDRCLKQKGRQFCGETPHFTNFAILLGGALPGGHSNPCGKDSSNYGYILGSWQNDLILTASVIATIILIGVLAIASVVMCPPVRRFVYGSEGMRIITLRAHQKKKKHGSSQEESENSRGSEMHPLASPL